LRAGLVDVTDLSLKMGERQRSTFLGFCELLRIAKISPVGTNPNWFHQKLSDMTVASLSTKSQFCYNEVSRLCLGKLLPLNDLQRPAIGRCCELIVEAFGAAVCLIACYVVTKERTND
jgi:hypothetical protein